MQLYNTDSSSGTVARAITTKGASKLTQKAGGEPSDSGDNCEDSQVNDMNMYDRLDWSM